MTMSDTEKLIISHMPVNYSDTCSLSSMPLHENKADNFVLVPRTAVVPDHSQFPITELDLVEWVWRIHVHEQHVHRPFLSRSQPDIVLPQEFYQDQLAHHTPHQSPGADLSPSAKVQRTLVGGRELVPTPVLLAAHSLEAEAVELHRLGEVFLRKGHGVAGEGDVGAFGKNFASGQGMGGHHFAIDRD
jgi:hypothetical protein